MQALFGENVFNANVWAEKMLNLENKKIGLIYRKDKIGYEFPKGHLEKGETLEECAIRETEEETGRKNHLLSEKEVEIVKYITSKGEDVELYFYIAIDDGPTDKIIANEDKEKWKFVDIENVEQELNFNNLIQFWNKIKGQVIEIIESNI